MNTPAIIEYVIPLLASVFINTFFEKTKPINKYTKSKKTAITKAGNKETNNVKKTISGSLEVSFL
ncbi:MAG: hypothetical protein QM499_12065 [Flavobacteriaceae bacterium]